VITSREPDDLDVHCILQHVLQYISPDDWSTSCLLGLSKESLLRTMVWLKGARTLGNESLVGVRDDLVIEGMEHASNLAAAAGMEFEHRGIKQLKHQFAEHSAERERRKSKWPTVRPSKASRRPDAGTDGEGGASGQQPVTYHDWHFLCSTGAAPGEKRAPPPLPERDQWLLAAAGIDEGEMTFHLDFSDFSQSTSEQLDQHPAAASAARADFRAVGVAPGNAAAAACWAEPAAAAWAQPPTSLDSARKPKKRARSAAHAADTARGGAAIQLTAARPSREYSPRVLQVEEAAEPGRGLVPTQGLVPAGVQQLVHKTVLLREVRAMLLNPSFVGHGPRPANLAPEAHTNCPPPPPRGADRRP
jgi:hypothetical protein